MNRDIKSDKDKLKLARISDRNKEKLLALYPYANNLNDRISLLLDNDNSTELTGIKRILNSETEKVIKDFPSPGIIDAHILWCFVIGYEEKPAEIKKIIKDVGIQNNLLPIVARQEIILSVYMKAMEGYYPTTKWAHLVFADHIYAVSFPKWVIRWEAEKSLFKSSIDNRLQQLVKNDVLIKMKAITKPQQGRYQLAREFSPDELKFIHSIIFLPPDYKTEICSIW